MGKISHTHFIGDLVGLTNGLDKNEEKISRLHQDWEPRTVPLAASHYIDYGTRVHAVNIDVRGSVHRSINHIEITNKMQLFTRIYYSNIY